MAETDLARLLGDMHPERLPGEFVYVEIPEGGLPQIETLATVKEAEGASAVVSRNDADRFKLDYDFVAAWITLTVESALSAVGLTAAVSDCLTDAGISCNVIAGLRHDHLLVPADRADEALAALDQLSGSRRT